MDCHYPVCVCVCVHPRGCVSHRLVQSLIDPSSSIGWCKCMSAILSPLVFTRKIAITSSSRPSARVCLCVLHLHRAKELPVLFPIVLSCRYLFPPLFLPFHLLCLFYIRLKSVFQPFISWAGCRKQPISDISMLVFCACFGIVLKFGRKKTTTKHWNQMTAQHW